MSVKTDLIGQIVSEAIYVSSTAAVDIFVSYSPHVDWVEITYFHIGWEHGRDGASTRICISDEPVKRLKKELRIIKRLKDKK